VKAACLLGDDYVRREMVVGGWQECVWEFELILNVQPMELAYKLATTKGEVLRLSSRF
jgi:hypothetical protein